ncbi:MAG TPA: hypothetical protein VFL29_08375 [Candidatus Dormibacteraeota bacterium]|nr:hypothetical protein [Candidatus Dormibacteraeota bacterium]
MIVVAGLLLPRDDLLPLLITFAVVAVFDFTFWWAIAARLRSYLRDGVLATAVIVQPASPRNLPRVEINGRETILRTTAARRLKAGDRIQVLTNQAGDKILVPLDQTTG